jgi:hypothetical protein
MNEEMVIDKWRNANAFEPPRGQDFVVELADGRCLSGLRWQPNALIAHWQDSQGNRYRAAGSRWLDAR